MASRMLDRRGRAGRFQVALCAMTLVATGCAASAASEPGLAETASGGAASTARPATTLSADLCAGKGLAAARDYGTIDGLLASVVSTAGDVATWIETRGGADGPVPDASTWRSLPADAVVAVCAYGGSGFAAPLPEGMEPYDLLVLLVPADGELVLDSFGHRADGMLLPSGGPEDGCGPVGEVVVADGQAPPRLGRGGGPATRERLDELPALTLEEAREAGQGDAVPEAVGGIGLRGVFGRGGMLLAYYTDGAYDAHQTRAGFMTGGGFIVRRVHPRVSRGDLAASVLAEVGERATEVAVGQYRGAIVHGDPVAPGLRPFGLWWSDESSDWSITAATADAASVVRFARELVCGSGLRFGVQPSPSPDATEPTTVPEGCGPADEPVLPDEPAPYRRRPSNEPALRDESTETTLAAGREAGFEARVPREREGLEVRYVTIRRRMLGIYLSDEEVGPTDTLSDFYAGGGVQILEIRPGKGGTGPRVAADPEIAATLVEVGPWSAALTHFDPVLPGLRPYGLYWSDDETDWSAVGGLDDPRDLIDIARSMVCE